MQDHLLDPEHRAFAAEVREFAAAEITPHYTAWEQAGLADREVWRAAGRAGFLGLGVAKEYGGRGLDDIRYPVILAEELIRAGAPGLGFSLHTEVIVPCVAELASDEQKARWLPGLCSGDLVAAIAISEPGAGSDLQSITTSATPDPDGDGLRLKGTKTFVSNGIHADLIVVAAKTNPADRLRGGISLLVLERGMPGLTRGAPLRKLGGHALDTAELFFDDVHVPAAQLLGRRDRGLRHLMDNLQRERLGIAAAAVAGAEAVFADTLERCRARAAEAVDDGDNHGNDGLRDAGAPGGGAQHIRFELAELSTELDVARRYIDQHLTDHLAGRRDTVAAARAKWWTTELQRRVVDRCVQLAGEPGWSQGSPAARAYLDTRMAPIYGGTNEIMKELIGRSLGV